MWILYCLGLCLVDSAYGQNDVRLPPSITRGPEREIIFREFVNITLLCRAEGTPPPTFEWRHNVRSRVINRHQSPFPGVSVGDLTIFNATRNDDGIYQCFVTNQYGTALSTMARIQHAFLQNVFPRIANITVQAGHPFVIPAAKINSFPTQTYRWETAIRLVDPNPRRFEPLQRVHRACNGDLHFAYALKEDELNGSIYKSVAYNAVTDIAMSGSYTSVKVTQGSGTPPDFPPNISYFAKSQEVALIGREIQLLCFASGKPLPNITWSRPGNNLPSGRYSIPSSQHGTSLNISNIMESDEGDYVCTASNTMGTASQTLNIRVEGVPIFNQVSDGPRNVNVTEGDSITFNCSAFAKPNATVIWLRNGQPIDVEKPPKRFSFSNDNRSLTIRNVCRDCPDPDRQTDLIVIQCKASNVHGYAFAQGYLNVLLKTKVTLLANSTFVSVDLTKKNRFQFDYRATSDPSTPPTVRWYKVRNNSHELVYSEPPYVYVMNGNLTINIGPNCSTICEKYLGEYRCIGDNGYTQDIVTVILNGSIESSSPSYCSGCFDKTSTDSHETTNHAKDDILNNTMVPEIASLLPDLNTMSEGLSPDNLSTAIMIKSQGIDSTTKHKVDDLKTTKLTPETQTVVAEVTNQLQALTIIMTKGACPRNLNDSVMSINQMTAQLRESNDSVNEEQVKSIVQMVNNLLRSNNSNAWKELNDGNRNCSLEANESMAMVILSALDVCGRSLSRMNKTGDTIGHTDSFVLEASSINKSNLPIEIEFPDVSLWGEDRGDGISISMETLNSISSESQPNLKMWGVYYRNIHDYLPGKKDGDGVINSRILSFSIDGLKTDQTIKPPVTIRLRHNQEKSMSFLRTCAFWNFDSGDWDSAGCSVQSTNKTHTICSCNHLTNFAILMSTTPSYDKTLSVISIIGCSISVAALALTVIVYAVTWKHAKSSQAALLINLCIALIIAYIIFMAGADKIESNGYLMVGCKVVAALLHYFFLAAFFIMLAEGVDMVLYIFFVFHVRRTRETVMLIASAWVLPMIIVGVSLGVTRLEGYGHEQACWLSIENGLLWAFIGPVLCIIAVNLVILIIILRLISKKKAILAKNSRKREEIRATIWNLSVMCPVLGLGWLCGVFSISFEHVAFQYVFVIANSLHGLLIFIIYALFHNKKMNETISAVYSQYRRTDSSVSNQMTNSSSQEHHTNSTANTRIARTSLQPKSSDSDEFGTKATISTHNSGLKDSLLENKADIHRETAFDHR